MHISLPAFGAISALIFAAMAGAWALQAATRNASWVDAVWSATTGAAGAAFALFAAHGPAWRRLMLAALALAWGLRLATYIAGRAATGHEDPRYAALRPLWGRRFQPYMFLFLQFQALVAWVLAAAVCLAAANPAPFLPLDALGVALIACGIAGEAAADAQLRAFRANPANKGGINERGLWAYSRHPNHFCDWLVWAGVALSALTVSPGGALGFAALAAPALMYVVLVHLSGAAAVERAMQASRGARFTAYCQRVPRFFPRLPRRPTRPSPS